MASRGIPLTFRARGLSDAIDGSNAFPGAMLSLANLVPAPHTPGFFVPRAASSKIANFGGPGASPIWGSFLWGAVNWGGFNSPAQLNALLIVGAIAYGMVAETGGPLTGKDVPFAFNLLTGAFRAITLPRGAAALPATPAAVGDWTPPTMAVVGSRIIVTHPGFPVGATKFGWLDISGFSDNTHTGTTHASTLVDGLSANVLQAGWQPGQTIAESHGDIPAGTTIISIAANGLSLVLSQAATGAHAGGTLTVAGGTAAVPLWDAGDTNLNNLASVPVAVTQFNGRAYYAVGNGVVLTDSGFPCQVTNASQALTFNNGLAVTALAGLPLTSTQLGGIIQSVIAFQGGANMQQISGDQATNNLSVNNLGVGVGTLAPNTITATPLGLAFVAPDGLRIIDFLARVSEPIGAHGQGVCVPFLNAIAPSRMVAAYNQTVMRISVQNGAALGQPSQEYWYDFDLKIWSGPHSFPAAQIAAYSNTFVMAATGINAALWQSDPIPTASSSYSENGAALAWTWQTSPLPDNEEMAENAVIESAMGFMLPPAGQIIVQAIDEASLTLDSVTLAGSGSAPTTWGTFVWGASPWGGATGFFRQFALAWHIPLVFKQATIRATGASLAGLAIGNLNLRYQRLGYLMQAVAASGGRI